MFGRRRVLVIERPGDLTPLTCCGCRGRIFGEDHTIVERKGVRMRYHNQCAQVEAYDQMREGIAQSVEGTRQVVNHHDRHVHSVLRGAM